MLQHRGENSTTQSRGEEDHSFKKKKKNRKKINQPNTPQEKRCKKGEGLMNRGLGYFFRIAPTLFLPPLPAFILTNTPRLLPPSLHIPSFPPSHHHDHVKEKKKATTHRQLRPIRHAQAQEYHVTRISRHSLRAPLRLVTWL